MEMPPFLRSFVDGPRPPKLVLGAIGLIALLGGGYFFLITPVEQRITALQGRQQQLTTELAQARAQVAEIQRFRREIAELQAKLEMLKVKLPTEKETPGLYKAVSEAAQVAGLGVSLFQPREPKPRDYVAEIPITITAEGGYHQVAEFFEKVAGLPRVVKMSELKLSGLTKSKSSLRADVTLATFMYRELPPPPKPGVPVPAPPKKAEITVPEGRS